MNKEDFKVYLVLFVLCVGLVGSIYGLISLLLSPRVYKTYESCMLYKMKNRPSSMHEIVSEYCQKATK